MNSLHALINELKDKKKSTDQEPRKWLTGKELKANPFVKAETAITSNSNSKKRELQRIEKLRDLISIETKKFDSSNTHNANENSSADIFKSISSFENPIDEDSIPPIPKEEIIAALRRFREPITLFGETDAQRFNRLYQLEITINDDGLKHQKQNLMIDSLAGRKSMDLDINDGSYDDHGKNIKSARAAHPIEQVDSDYSEASDNEGGKIETTIDTTPNTDPKLEQSKKIKYWIKAMLKDWEEELHNRTEEQKKTTEGRTESRMHRQTRKDLKPLLKKLKTKSLEDDILNKLSKMVELCQKRHYRDAHDIYMLLAIGNAAWPMGVTMVGIHERAGRSKIFTSEVAHILNDETTRKYIQMFKRLMSLSQRKYPADPSQMVKIASVNI